MIPWLRPNRPSANNALVNLDQHFRCCDDLSGCSVKLFQANRRRSHSPVSERDRAAERGGPEVAERSHQRIVTKFANYPWPKRAALDLDNHRLAVPDSDVGLTGEQHVCLTEQYAGTFADRQCGVAHVSDQRSEVLTALFNRLDEDFELVASQSVHELHDVGPLSLERWSQVGNPGCGWTVGRVDRHDAGRNVADRSESHVGVETERIGLREHLRRTDGCAPQTPFGEPQRAIGPSAPACGDLRKIGFEHRANQTQVIRSWGALDGRCAEQFGDGLRMFETPHDLAPGISTASFAQSKHLHVTELRETGSRLKGLRPGACDNGPMAVTGTDPNVLDLLAPGARVIVRDLEWQIEEVELQALGRRAVVRCSGRCELVRGQAASFFSDLDRIVPEDPSATKFRLDTSPQGLETRLVIESRVRRTPLPVSTTEVMVGHRILADDLPFQREPWRKTTEQLQPRILIADAVGLGKTLEVGIMLSELQRRGRANRVLAVVPRHILDQVQHELWCRFGFPLVRLDSEGIRRLRQRIPAGRNPFTYYNRAIVSIDTLKQPGTYRHHLERVRWDAVWIDESHKLVNKGTLNNQLAQVLAPNADALILSSATPHNGKPESFAELVSLLDPTAVPDPTNVTADDIGHLVVRRHKHSPDVAAVIGDNWAERKEPVVVTVKPSPEEERIFTALTDKWLLTKERRDAGETTVASDPLFAYTLLKAALSSPEALNETVARRATKRRLDALVEGQEPPATPEEAALKELWALSLDALEGRSAKLDAIVATLEEIGVGPNSPTRAVIFSERIGTLDWIANAVRERLGLDDDAVVTFHNSKSDEEQQQIVEDFAMASAPVRVLVTSDIASEGVNLHKQCHHLIHADLPWSLITTTQRNGRIDRYGQLHQPEIRYLVYLPDNEEIAGDVRVLSKLIAKEHEAHKALGDAASVMGLHSESAEEDAIIAVLRERDQAAKESALEEKAPTDAVWDPWAFAGLTSGTNESDSSPAVAAAPTGEVPSLFASDTSFLEQGLRLAFGSLTELDWETDDAIVSFKPPDDLLRRLEVLPQSYLKQRDLSRRLRLTDDIASGNRSLADALEAKAAAGEAGTAWPEVHFLGPQHPVLDWISDKVLYRLDRNEAPALPADVDAPTALISGVWANKLGEPIAAAWLAATIEDGMVTFENMFGALRRAGVDERMVNPIWDGDLAAVETALPQMIIAATGRLTDMLDDQISAVTGRLDRSAERVQQWQVQARGIADAMKPGPHRTRRFENIERTSRQVEALIAENQPADSPLIRVVGALVPKN